MKVYLLKHKQSGMYLMARQSYVYVKTPIANNLNNSNAGYYKYTNFVDPKDIDGCNGEPLLFSLSQVKKPNTSKSLWKVFHNILAHVQNGIGF